MWTSKILLFLYCLYVFWPQVWWISSCSNYWEHPRGERLERAHGPSHGHVPRFLRCSGPQTRSLRLGRDLGESKDHVSYEMKCTPHFFYVHNMYLSFKTVIFQVWMLWLLIWHSCSDETVWLGPFCSSHWR